MPSRLIWNPNHRLTWIPRPGVIRIWLVRVIATEVAGRLALVAQTAEEDRHRKSPAWVFLEDSGEWTWQGLPGYGGEVGTATLERLDY